MVIKIELTYPFFFNDLFPELWLATDIDEESVDSTSSIELLDAVVVSVSLPSSFLRSTSVVEGVFPNSRLILFQQAVEIFLFKNESFPRGRWCS